MDLIGFVVACKGVHHQIDAESKGHFALAFAAWHRREQRSALGIRRPGGGPVMVADNDRRHPVIHLGIPTFDPNIAAGLAAGEILQ